ncbi:MAG: class I SAM-dependent methyltransferase [Candidatus Bathyarchaeota archaeon]|nr:class I SAM-dependent methyltransferase [Candidatus Bathyarchaeota archaeon]
MQMEELLQINEKTRKSYNLACEKYYKLFKDEMKQKEYDRRLLDKFASNFDSKSIICDAGCGPGHITKYLFDKGLDVFGIDISEECIEIARRENPKMRFQIMDMARLDIADESIDGIISFYSIIHTPKRFVHVLFCEFNRILKKNGKLLVVVKKGETEGYKDELEGFKTDLYFTNFTEEEIKSFLEANGFAVIFLETRQPYDFEIPVERVYAIGRKIS